MKALFRLENKNIYEKDAPNGNKKYDMNCWNTNLLFHFF